MITVKLFGLLRLRSGIRERQLEADTVADALQALSAWGISRKELDGCLILVNGTPANKRTRLVPGDTLVLMSPVAGG